MKTAKIVFFLKLSTTGDGHFGTSSNLKPWSHDPSLIHFKQKITASPKEVRAILNLTKSKQKSLRLIRFYTKI